MVTDEELITPYEVVNSEVNRSTDFLFKIRGDVDNLFINLADALIGLALRLRSLNDCPQIVTIYQQVSEEIHNIELELIESQVEPALVIAYRYVLCSFFDESVLSTSWGADSLWAENSMLAKFHNETWGGEKFFSILERLEVEPKRYSALLKFIYLCLILGFEGKYRVIEGGIAQREKVIIRLRDILSDTDKTQDVDTSLSTNNIEKNGQILAKQWSIWSVFLVFSTVLFFAYFIYSYRLAQKSTNVLEQLNQLLS